MYYFDYEADIIMVNKDDWVCVIKFHIVRFVTVI